MSYNWTPYAIGGALRPDAFSGMTQPMQQGLFGLLQAADDQIGPGLQVYSGYRSPERQEQLWNSALEKYGSPEAARKWVAPPGRSQHNKGNAADLKYNGTRIDQLPEDHPVHAFLADNVASFGLARPMSWEPWQVELEGTRGAQPQAASPPPAQEPMQPQSPFQGLGKDPLFDLGLDDGQQTALAGLAQYAAGMQSQEQAEPPMAPMQAQAVPRARRDTLDPYLSLFEGIRNGRF